MLDIRAADESDAADLAEFAERVFLDTFASQNAAEDIETYRRSAFGLEIQRAEVTDPHAATLLAFTSPRVIGAFAHCRFGAASADVPCEMPVEIQRFYVDRAWHGRGVARALMSAVLARAKVEGCDCVWLGVWERNPRAIAFYEKCGFRVVGAQVFVLGTAVQRDLVMALDL